MGLVCSDFDELGDELYSIVKEQSQARLLKNTAGYITLADLKTLFGRLCVRYNKSPEQIKTESRREAQLVSPSKIPLSLRRLDTMTSTHLTVGWRMAEPKENYLRRGNVLAGSYVTALRVDPAVTVINIRLPDLLRISPAPRWPPAIPSEPMWS